MTDDSKSLQLSEEIYPIPEMPKEILKAVSNKNLIVFVGAGVSRIIGCLGWKELADNLVDVSFDNKLISYWEREKLKTHEPRKIISIMKSTLEPFVYQTALECSLKHKPEVISYYPIYDYLIKFRGTFITTNIDEHFDKHFVPQRIYTEPNQFPTKKLKQDTLFKLHGSIKNHETLILTIQDYIKHYNKPEIIGFLKNIFNGNYIILFVGYSLAELEILDYVLLKGNKDESESHKVAKYFLLLPFYKLEKSLLSYERKYFDALNIIVKPYAIDEKGYEQLYFVIKEWEKEINITSPYFHEKVKFIDDNVNAYNETNASEILQLIKNDNHFRNYFFKKLTTVEWFTQLKEKGYFSSDRAPISVPSEQQGYFSVPEWDVLPYLETVSRQVNISDNGKYIDDLIKIINDVSNHTDSNGQHIDNYKTWWYFVKILCNLPNDRISDEIINLIPRWLNSKFDTSLQESEIVEKLLPKFLNSNNPDDWGKAEKIVEIITDIKWISVHEEEPVNDVSDFESAFKDGLKEDDKFVTCINPYYLLKSFKRNAVKVGEKCTEKVIFTIADRLNIILKQEYSKEIKTTDISYIWFSSLYSETDIDEHRADRILVTILRDVLLSKAKHNTEQTKKIIDEFLDETYKFPIFKRLVLYVIGNVWKSYKDIFKNMIKINGINYFNDLHYRPELYKLLESNCKKFETDEKNLIKNIIEHDTQSEKDAENKEIYRAYRKQQWYFALKSDPEFKLLYEEQRKIYTIPEDEIHTESIYHRSFSGPGSSPFTDNEIVNLSNAEIAMNLKTFEQKEEWFGQPDLKTVGGLSEHLKELARETPNRFTDNLKPFKDTGYIYVYSILRGIKDAWVAKKNIDWSKLFEFIHDYINRDEFVGDMLKVKYNSANHQWVIGIIAELMQDGTRDDSWAFNEEYFNKAKEIVFLLLGKSEGNKDVKEITDYDLHTLNSPLGKSLKALVYLSLRIKRVNEKTNSTYDIKWSLDKFDEILEKKFIEAYVSLGNHFINLAYLDRTWVEANVDSLKKYYDYDYDVKYWEAFMDGFLSVGTVYNDFYGLMKPHFLHGISSYYDKFKKDSNKKFLIQYICVYYLLREDETLINSEGLFKKLIDIWKAEQIIEIIDYFWMQRNDENINSEENNKMKPKIIEFWKVIYEKYKNVEKENVQDEDRLILSCASKLAIFLPKIDEKTYLWLKLSAPYVNVDHNSRFFIEHLNELKLKDKCDNAETAKYIGEIYLEMLNNFTPDFDEEHTSSIVEFLYNAGAKVNANKICNIYGSRGSEFLRELYEKNNP